MLVLGHPESVAGNLDTHFRDRHAADVRTPAPTDDQLRAAAIAATPAGVAARRAVVGPVPGVVFGWRNVRHADEQVRFVAGDRPSRSATATSATAAS